MAKKRAPPEPRTTQTNSRTITPTKPKPSGPAAANSKTTRNRKSHNDATVTPIISTPTSSEEAVVSTDAEEIEGTTSDGEAAEEEEDIEEPQNSMKKGRNKDAKTKRKRRGKEEDDEEDDPEKEAENRQPYTFPMNRVDRIIRSEIPDLKIAQEAVFLINRSTEKFLQMFCKEAYSCAVLDKKSYVAYNHLSSVVSKRERLKFLSDFIPEKMKAEDALAQIAEAEKQAETNLNGRV